MKLRPVVLVSPKKIWHSLILFAVLLMAFPVYSYGQTRHYALGTVSEGRNSAAFVIAGYGSFNPTTDNAHATITGGNNAGKEDAAFAVLEASNPMALLFGSAGESWVQMTYMADLEPEVTSYVHIGKLESSGFTLDIVNGLLSNLLNLLSNNIIIPEAYIGTTFVESRNGIVLDKEGNIYVSVKPSAKYSSVRLKLRNATATTLGVGNTTYKLKVYNTFNYGTVEPCAAANFTDQGTSTGLTVSLSEVLINPEFAIDGNKASYSLLTTPTIGLGSSVAQNIYFPVLSENNSVLKIQYGLTASTLDLKLLGNYRVRAYNGSTKVLDKGLNEGSSLIGLDLLGLFRSGGSTVISYPILEKFDRVEIYAGGVLGVNLGSSIKIHNISRTSASCPEPPPTASPLISPVCVNTEIISEAHVDDKEFVVDGNFDSYATIRSSAGLLLGLGGSYSGHLELGFPAAVPAGKTTYIRIDYDEAVLKSLVAGSLGNTVTGLAGALLLGQHYFTVEAKSSNNAVDNFTGSSADNFASTNGKMRIVQDAKGHYYIALKSNKSYNNIRITDHTNAAVGLLAKPNYLAVYNVCYENSDAICDPAFSTSYDGSGLSLDLLNLGANGVKNAHHALDGNESTKSEINLGVLNVGGAMHQYFNFHKLSKPQDHFNITLSVDAGSVANLSLLSNIEIKAYANGIEVFARKVSEDVIGLDLLNLLQSGKPTLLRIAPGVAFDQISIGKSALVDVNLLSSPLFIHKVERFSFGCEDPGLVIPAVTADPFNIAACADELIGFSGVNFPFNAVDGNNETFARLTSGTGVAANIGGYNSHIELGYAAAVPARTTSYIRVNFEEAMLGSLLGGSLGDIVGNLLGNVVLGNHSFKVDVKRADGTSILTRDSKNKFADHYVKLVKDAQGRYYIAVTADENYKSVQITHELNSLIGLGKVATMDVYNMCHESAPEFCDQAAFVSYDGSGLSLSLDLLDLTKGGVLDPQNVIDQNTSNYATISLGVAGIGAKIYQNIYFTAASKGTDKLRFRVELQHAGLLNLELIGSYNVILYHAGKEVYNKSLKSGIINNLNLLDLLNSGGIQEFTIEPGVVFDRVQFGQNATVVINAGAPLRLYEVSRISEDCPDPTFEESPLIAPACATFIAADNVDNIQNLVDGNHNSYATIRSSAGIAANLNGYDGYVELGYSGTNVAAGTTSYIRIDTESTLLQSLLGGSLGAVLSKVVANIVLGDHFFEVLVKDKDGGVVTSGSSSDLFAGSNGTIKIVQDAEGRYYIALTPEYAYSTVRITDKTNALLGLDKKNSINVYGMCYETNTANCAFPLTTSFDGSGLSLDLTGLGGYGVTNGYRAIDPKNTSDYSEISLGALAVAGSVEQKVQFNKSVNANTIVKLDLSIGDGVLDVGLFGRMDLVAYKNGAAVYVRDLESAVLGNVNLLNLFNNGQQAEISFAPDMDFDEVGIRLRSLVSVTAVPNVKLYAVEVDCDAVIEPEFVAWKSFLIDNDISLKSVKANEEITYTIHVRNTGQLALNDITITDAIPANTTFVSAENDLQPAANVLTFTGIDVAVGASVTRSFTVKVNADLTGVDNISNVALVNGQPTLPPSVLDPNQPDIDATVPGTLIPVDKINAVVSWKAYAVDGDKTKTSVSGGEEVAYAIYVRNTGNQILNNISITDELPLGLTWKSGGTLDARKVSFVIPTLAVGATSLPLHFVVTVDKDLTNILEIRNIALVKLDATDPGTPSYPPLNNEDPKEPNELTPGTVLTVVPDHQVEFTKAGKSNNTVSTGQAQIGDEITYTLVVKNTGNKTLENLVVEDVLPAELSLVETDGAINGQVITFNITSLAVDAEETFTIKVKVETLSNNQTAIINSAKTTFRNEDNTDNKVVPVTHSISTLCTAIIADDILFDETDMKVCAGADFTITASSNLSGLTNAVYRWYTKPDLTGSFVAGASFTGRVTKTTTYYVTLEAEGYCFSVPAATVTVTVEAAAGIPTISPSSVVVCENENLVLTATATNATTFEWYKGVTKLPEASNILTIANAGLLDAGAYTVKAVNVTGCASAASAVVDVDVSQKPTKPVIVVNGALAICEGETLKLTSSAGTYFEWFLNGNLIEFKELSDPNDSNSAVVLKTRTKRNSIDVKVGGDYSVIVYNVNNCGSEMSTPISVEVNPLPVITSIELNDIVQNAISLAPSEELRVALNATGLNLTYTWEINSGGVWNVYTATSPSFTYVVPLAAAGRVYKFRATIKSDQGCEILTDEIMLTVKAQEIDYTKSKIEVLANNAIADGVASNRVRVSLLDKFDNPVAGAAVTYAVTGLADVSTSSLTGVSDADGYFDITLKSQKIGTANVTALAAGSAITLGSPAQVVFVAGAVDHTKSKLVVTKDNAIADGVDYNEFTATIVDKFNNPIANQDVVLNIEHPDGGSTTQTLTTDAAGVAVLQVSSTKAGEVEVAALVDTQDISGSPATATFVAGAVDHTKSKLVVTKDNAVADGVDFNAFTATIVDEFNNPIANQDVVFNIEHPDGSSTTQTLTTDAAGVAVLQVSSTKAGEVEVAALVDTKDIAGSPATATFVAGAVDHTKSKLVVTKDNAIADGVDYNEFTATIVDKFNNPIANQDVVFNIEHPDGSSTTQTLTTDAAGVAVLQVSSTKAGEVVVAALVDTKDIAGSPATATFVAGAVDHTKSKLVVTKDNAVADGVDYNEFTATIVDKFNNPIANQDVVFNIEHPDGSSTAQTVTTDAAGVAVLQVSSTKAGEVEVAALVDTKDIAGSPATATFVAGAVDHTKSKLVVTKDNAIADGVDYNEFTATIVDKFNNPIANQDVVFNIEHPDGSSTTQTLTTDAAGVAVLQVSSTKAGEVVVAALVDTQDIAGSPATATFVAGAVDHTKSKLVVTKDNAVADGVDYNEFTATIVDEFNNPIANQDVVFNIEHPDGSSTAQTLTTDAAGVAVLQVSSTKAGKVTVEALVDAQEIADSPAQATFVAGAVDHTKSKLVVTKDNAIADGVDYNEFTATLVDKNGNAIANQDVVFNINHPDGSSTTQTLTTDAAGVAVLQVSSTKAGEVVVAALVDTKDIAGSPATANFKVANVISVTKQADELSVKAGAQTSFTITLTNNGPAALAIGRTIKLGEAPSAGLTIKGYEVVSKNATVLGTGNTATVTATESVAIAGTIVVKVSATVAADAPVSISNGIKVWGPEKPVTETPDDEDKTPEIPVVYETKLSVKKKADQTTVKIGESTTFTIEVKNDGPSVIEKGKTIHLTERPGQGLRIVDFMISSNNATINANGNNAIVMTTAPVAVGGLIVVKVTAQVEETAGATVSNGVSVWRPGKEFGTDPEDDKDDTDPIPVVVPRIQANDDEAEAKAANKIVIEVLANDEVTLWAINPATVMLVKQPTAGTATANIDGTISYTSNKDASGTDVFSYRVQDIKGEWSNEAEVRVKIADNPLIIPNAFTPNNDNTNDTFFILGLEAYDKVSLKIINRWGNEVYSNDNYNNEWNGTGLNAGTYFYFIEASKSGKKEVLKGSVLIKRN